MAGGLDFQGERAEAVMGNDPTLCSEQEGGICKEETYPSNNCPAAGGTPQTLVQGAAVGKKIAEDEEEKKRRGQAEQEI
ncbi:MAG: hypothetical protein ACLT63_06660 [Bacteroides xylanisolvens]